MALHYAREDFADAGELARVLGRERAKDTSLDYGGGPEDLAQGYAARRGFGVESEIVWRQARAQQARAAQQQELAAGKARFRERYAAHRQERATAAEAAERDGQAGALVGQWDRLIKDYGAALPGLDRDPAYGLARELLVAFGQTLRARPELAAVLRERGEVFGLAERPNLQRVLADAKPEQVIAGIVADSEGAQREQRRAEVQAQAHAQERARQAEEAARRVTLRPRGRGPSLGM